MDFERHDPSAPETVLAAPFLADGFNADFRGGKIINLLSPSGSLGIAEGDG
jgi:hypothetical protein